MPRESVVSGLEQFSNVFGGQLVNLANRRIKRRDEQEEFGRSAQLELLKKGYILTPTGVQRVPGMQTPIESILDLARGQRGGPQGALQGIQGSQGRLPGIPGQGALELLQGQGGQPGLPGQGSQPGLPGRFSPQGSPQQAQQQYPLEGLLPPGARFQDEGFNIPLTSPAERFPTIEQNRRFMFDIRKEFERENQDFAIVRRSVSNVNTSFNRIIQNPSGSRGAVDIALITAFRKIFDPTSAVMQSEFLTTADAVPLISKLKGLGQKIAGGGVGVTDKDRAEFVALANQVMDSVGDEFNLSYDKRKAQIRGYGLSPELVLAGYKNYRPDLKAFRGTSDEAEMLFGRSRRVIPSPSQPIQGQGAGQSVRNQYNLLRSQGVPAEEAKRRLGL